MPRLLLALLILCWTIGFAQAEDRSTIQFPSPDGRFALQITASNGEDEVQRVVALVEKSSGKVMVDLGTAYRAHLPETVLVWSADSKWAAYGTRDDREGEASIYYWNGTAFDEVKLPDTLPDPKIKFGKGADGAVKNYGGAVKPLRWLKSGELELSSEQIMMSRVNDKTYTGVVVFTLAFDTQHHASVHNVGRTKTQVD